MSGAVLHMPYGQVDKLCKLVPNNPTNPVTLPQAVEGEPKLQEARDSDPVVARGSLEIAHGRPLPPRLYPRGPPAFGRACPALSATPRSRLPITQFNWKLVETAAS